MIKKNIIGHLQDLRDVILKSILAILVCAGISCFFLPKFFKMLLIPYYHLLSLVDAKNLYGIESIRALGPSETMLISIKLVLVIAVIFAMPIILFQLWRFVVPGLFPKERRSLYVVLLLSPLFFTAGVLFSYFVVFPLALRFLWKYTVLMGVLPEWTILYYFNFEIGFLSAFGIAFELPIVVVLLAKLKLVSPQILTSKRKHAIVIVFILAAILTPPDVISQVLLGVPMIVLYEISILMAKLVYRSKL